MGQNPTTDRLVLKDDNIVYRVATRKGKYRDYESDGVQIGHISIIEKKRPDLIPKIQGYIRPEERGIVPDPHDYPVSRTESIEVDGMTVEEETYPLEEALAEIDDAGIVREMMRRDTRNRGEKFYIKRIEAIEDETVDIATVPVTAGGEPADEDEAEEEE